MKCVWMLSGNIDYKLCDREYDCERCPFHLAIRGQDPFTVSRRRVPGGTAPIWERSTDQFDVHGCVIRDTLFYTPGHVWMRVESSRRVRIGLDDFGQKLLGRVYSVALPRPGGRISPRSPAWKVAHVAGETVLGVPLAGLVSEVNERLVQHPSLINRDPYGHGAAMVIESQGLLEGLQRAYYGAEVERWYERDIERLERELKGTGTGACRGPPGTEIAEREARIEELLRAVSAPRLRRIIDSFLASSVSDRCEPLSPGPARP